MCSYAENIRSWVVSKTYAKASLKIAYKITVYRKVFCQLVAMPNQFRG